MGIALFWLGTYVCIKGVSWISKVTDFAGTARFIMGIAFIILAFILVLGMKEAPAQEFTMETVAPKFNWTFFMVMAWVLQAVGGGESIGVYIKDVKGGNKTFIKTMILSTFVIGAMYVLGAIAVGFAVPHELIAGNFSNAIFVVFDNLLTQFGIPTGVTVRLVGLILCLGSLGALALWTAAPVKVFFSEIPEGVFGKWLVKTNEEGNPTNALVVQGIVVTILIAIPALGIGSMDSFLETLLNMTAGTSLLPMLFLIFAYIKLRWKHEDMPRDYRFGNRTVGIITGIFLFILFLFIFFMSTVPDPAIMKQALNGTLPEGVANPFGLLAYSVAGLVIFVGVAWAAWNRYEKKNKIENK